MRLFAERILSKWPLAIFALALLSSCSSEKQGTSFELSKTYDSGAVSAVLELSSQEISVAEFLELRLTVTAPKDYLLQVPEPESDFGEFSLADYFVEQDLITLDAQLKREVTYLLEPFLSGDYVLPPLEIDYWPSGNAVSPPKRFKTKEIPVTVSSVLSPEETSPELRDIASIGELPVSHLLRWIAVLAALLLSAAYFLKKDKIVSGDEDIPVTPAHVLALRELEELLGKGMIARGEFSAFHAELTSILRRYIENGLGLRALSRTTLEFMAAVDEDAVFSEKHKATLQPFLNHCDLVKFAGITPESDSIEQTIKTCRGFIENTSGAAAPGNGGEL